MEMDRFDHLTRLVAGGLSRRKLGGALGLGVLAIPGWTDARKKKRKRKRKKQKRNVTFNDFGCVDVGGVCTNGGQCCSGICQGKQGKQTCRAHDGSTCQGEDSCLDTPFPCITTTGEEGGICTITTGKAAYCAAVTATRCFDCTKDADCVPHCGPQAACIACADCIAINGEETACAGPGATSCTIPK
jgi:hypothetical protein